VEIINVTYVLNNISDNIYLATSLNISKFIFSFCSVLFFISLILKNRGVHLQVLGTPTREEIKCMNPNYTEFKFPQIKAHPWHKVCNVSLSVLLNRSPCSETYLYLIFHHQIFHKRMPPEAVDLVSRLLQYSPNLRSTAVSIWFYMTCRSEHYRYVLISNWTLS
jgi:hypothetical protein